MSRICTLCGKAGRMVWHLEKLRGKFNPTSKQRKHPNLQWATLASGKRVKACAQCIKTLGKKK